MADVSIPSQESLRTQFDGLDAIRTRLEGSRVDIEQIRDSITILEAEELDTSTGNLRDLVSYALDVITEAIGMATPLEHGPDHTQPPLGMRNPSIARGPVARRLECEQEKLWLAMGIVRTTALALTEHFGDWPAHIPEFPRVLNGAAKIIDDVSGRLEPAVLAEAAHG